MEFGSGERGGGAGGGFKVGRPVKTALYVTSDSSVCGGAGNSGS